MKRTSKYPKLIRPIMSEIKNGSLNMQAGSQPVSVQLPGLASTEGDGNPSVTLLSSDDVVRAISSRIQNTMAAHIRVLAVVNFDLVDSATGKVVKSVSSLSSEVISDLPADKRDFFQTQLGSGLLILLLSTIFNFLGLLYQQHSAEVSQRETEQFVKQMAQSVEQLFLSHSEQATPTPAPNPPQGD